MDDVVTETDESTAVDMSYTIHNAVMSDTGVSMKYSAKQDATLVVEVYSEDLKELLESKEITVNAGSEQEAMVSLEAARRERYAYRVRMKDKSGTDLCAPYIDVTKTTAYESMMKKTPSDFRADKVLELGNDSGFFVLGEDVIVLSNGENAAFSSYDEKSDVLVLDSCDETLEAGNKIVVLDQGCLVACITAKEVKATKDRITVNGTKDDSLTDYFDYFRLAFTVDESLLETDAIAAASKDAGGMFEYQSVQSSSEEEGGYVGKNGTIPYDTDSKVNFAGDLNVTGSMKGEANIVFSAAWDKNFLPDNSYFYMYVSVNTTPHISMELQYGHEFDGSVDYDDDTILTSELMTQTPVKNGVHISLAYVGYTLGDSKWKWLQKIGDNFYFLSDFAIDITGDLAGSVGIDVVTTVDIMGACNVVKGSWGIPASETYFNVNVTDTNISYTAKASADVFVGLKYSLQARLAKLVKLDLKARAGALAEAKMVARSEPLWPEHPCLLCCEASARPVVDYHFEGGVETSWNIFDKDDDKNVERNVLKFEGEFPFDLEVSGYASLVHDPAADNCYEKFPVYFGLGTNVCPTELLPVRFVAIGEEDEALSVEINAVRSDGLWDSVKGSKTAVVTDTSNDVAYFYPGEYTVTAEYDGQTATTTFTVPGTDCVTLDFRSVNYYQYIRDNILPVRGYAKQTTFSDSFVSNQYYNGTGDWYSNTGILSANICDMNKDGVDDCVLFYIDNIPDNTRNEHAIYAQVYTVEKGTIVPMGDPLAIANAGGVSYLTAYVGICEINGQNYIYQQRFGYSFVAAGSQEIAMCDYFYGFVNDQLELIMYTAKSRYNYQDEREIPGGLKVCAGGAGFTTQEIADDELNQKAYEYLGLTDYSTIEYGCPQAYHSTLRHKSHTTPTLWGTTSLTPSFYWKSYDTSYSSNLVTVEATVTDCTELEENINKQP